MSVFGTQATNSFICARILALVLLACKLSADKALVQSMMLKLSSFCAALHCSTRALRTFGHCLFLEKRNSQKVHGRVSMTAFCFLLNFFVLDRWPFPSNELLVTAVDLK